MKQDGVIAQPLRGGGGVFPLLPCLYLTAVRVGMMYTCLGTEVLKPMESGTTLTPSATLEPEGHNNGAEDLGHGFSVRTSFPFLALKE